MVRLLGREWTLGLEEVKKADLWRGCAGEFVASFCFLLTCAIGVRSPTDLVAGALGTGLCIAILVQMFNAVSGGNINPAVTLALLVNGQISLIRAVLYIVVQIVGAICGSAVVYAMVRTDVFVYGNCIPAMADEGWKGMVLEALFTAMLIFQVLRCTDKDNPVGESANVALSVGLVVVVANFCLIPVTGGPINPIRYLGPAIVGGKLEEMHFYLLAHVAAALLTPFLYRPLLNSIKSEGEYSAERAASNKSHHHEENNM